MGAFDTHLHLWDLDRVRYPWLNEDWGILYGSHSPREIQLQMEKADVATALLVQSVNSYEETDFLLEKASQLNWVAGVIGWIPMDNPEESEKIIEKYKQNPIYRGVRYITHVESVPTWIFEERIWKILQMLKAADLTLDALAVMPENFMAISIMGEKCPELHIVLDHLAYPPISSGDFRRWAGYISMLAENPNIYIKISGLGTLSGNPDSWGASDIKRYVDFIMEKFGLNRVMIGGDWPYCNLARGYIHTWNQYRALLSDLSRIEQSMVLERNPRRFYGVEQPSVVKS